MKERLDVLLVKRNLAASRVKRAKKPSLCPGIVYVDGAKKKTRPGLLFRKKL